MARTMTLFLLLLFAVAVSACGSDEVNFSRDAAALVEAVEETHPIFVIEGMLPDYYEDIRQEFLEATSHPMTTGQFRFAVERYFTVLRDGHMSFLGSVAYDYSDFLDTELAMLGGRLVLASAPDVEVKSIGGLSVDELVSFVGQNYFFENNSAWNLHFPYLVTFGAVLRQVGAEIADGDGSLSVRLVLLDEGTETVLYASLGYERTVTRRAPADFIIDHEWHDDILLIDLRIFTDGVHITRMAELITEAVAQGTRNFIVDLRGNPGGDSTAGYRLLRAMGVRVPLHGVIRRMSPLAAEQRGFDETTGTLEFAPNTFSRNPNDVFVSVLTDRYTFSSAMMMGVWVQDGGFGNIVGEPSSNAPSSFGDMLFFRLPYLDVYVPISFTRFLRPDVNADQDTLWPDILVPADEALEAAIEYMRSR